MDNLQCLCIRCHNEVHERLDKIEKKPIMNEEQW
ncbi:hypothetical protein [Bacillus cereus group sp. RP43]